MRDEDDEEEGVRCRTGRPKPRLKAGDTLLLTLEIRQLERKAPEIEERERREQQAAGRSRPNTRSR